MDPDEYSKYFPNFLWVVRDFALQLVDSEGEPINSKEYLEKALAGQKGFTESVEQKNRIRRLLKAFFKDRDCCTMVRPLTKEDELQSLESIDMKDLREEFVEQVMTLRRKVLHRVKPKMLNGAELNGDMLAGLVTSYVNSINTGVVPNIQTAWSYICKSECQKAVEESLKIFESEMDDAFAMRAPMYEPELKEIYKDAKKEALEKFNEVSLGDYATEFADELKEKFKQIYSHYRQENERAQQQKANAFLQTNFAPIEQKLRNGQYATFTDFEKDLNEMQVRFLEEGLFKNELLEFCIHQLSQACMYFIRSTENEITNMKMLNEQMVKKLEEKVQELKDELKDSKSQLENRVRSLETDKAHLEAKEQTLQESVQQLRLEKDKVETDFKQRLQQEKKESQSLVEEYKQNANLAEQNAKELQRQVMNAESNFDKEKALLEQKNTHLEQTVESLKEKEKELTSDLRAQKDEWKATIKEAQGKNEAKIKELQEKLETQTEAYLEKESEFVEKEQKLTAENQTLEDKASKQETKITEMKAQLEQLQSANTQMEEEL